jgi:flagella basal body P-ring formation protein FlgA
VDIAVDGVFVRAVPVSFHVEAYGPGWTARRDMAAGEPVDPDAFERAEVDLAQLPGPPLAAWPVSARMRRPLLAHQVLTASHVESAPAVARGAPIRLVARQGGIALESAALALQDGWTGQRILVRAPRSTAPLAGQVRSAGLVELTP